MRLGRAALMASTIWLRGEPIGPGPGRAPAQAPARPRPFGRPPEGGRGIRADGRRGDVPENAAEQVTPETDRAIESGLAWLAKQQNSDGSYGSGAYRGNIAVTSLAGLAFMANGSSPGRGPYGSQIDKALQYVMDNTAPSGFIAVANAGTHGPMYSHGFGTLFLAEAYGMTKKAEIREKLTNAVRLIIDTQNAEGGWRYQPVRKDADISVTICQINALAGRPECRVVRPQGDGRRLHPLRQAVAEPRRRLPLHDPGRHAQRLPPVGGFGVVALYSAAVYDADEIKRAIDYLKQFMPEIKFGQRYSHYYYGHYYAAQAMWIRGGEDWDAWYPAIRDELVRRQLPAGFWQDSICHEYGTAMALIILQMPNNYLPIFQR